MRGREEVEATFVGSTQKEKAWLEVLLDIREQNERKEPFSEAWEKHRGKVVRSIERRNHVFIVIRRVLDSDFVSDVGKLEEIGKLVEGIEAETPAVRQSTLSGSHVNCACGARYMRKRGKCPEPDCQRPVPQ